MSVRIASEVCKVFFTVFVKILTFLYVCVIRTEKRRSPKIKPNACTILVRPLSLGHFDCCAMFIVYSLFSFLVII
jgi:hypothetical protein